MTGKTLLLAALQGVIEDANGGQWPVRLRDWRRVGERFNHRIVWMDLEWGMDAHAVGGVVYANPWHSGLGRDRRDRIENELRHEMIETACVYEGRPPLCYPPEWGDHHQMTVNLEEHLKAKSTGIGTAESTEELPEGFLARPLDEWPLNLRKALALVQKMPPEVQEHIIGLWLDQAEPHYRIAMALKDAEERLARVTQEIADKLNGER